MLTADQIATFYTSASCAWASSYSAITEKMRKGKPYCKSSISDLQLQGVMLERLFGYDPDSETNCVEYDDMLSVIEYLSVTLGVCMDDLDAVAQQIRLDGIDYMNIALGDNVGQVG